LRKYFIVSSSWESTFSKKKNMENKPQAINIAYGRIFGFHVLDVDDFRCNIAWGSTSYE
jgi:hypothetical protein